MVVVQKFGPAFGLPDPSPFVCKVETYLRLSGEPYETALGDPRKAPRGQIPFADVNGTRITDSTAIVDALEAARSEKLDGHLDAKQRAVGLAFKVMLEEELYFGVLFMRWACDDGWAAFVPGLRGMLTARGIPSFLHGFVAAQARKGTIDRTRVQGIGRKPRAEVVAICTKILDALAEQLGPGPFFFGDRPTTYDATVYAFALGVMCPAFENELRKHAASKANLVAYVDRLKQKYWTD
jgi:glutathione S-transferase